MNRDEAIEVIKEEDAELLQRLSYDELLDKIAQKGLEPHGNVMPTHLVLALRAVVELHTAFTPEFGGGINYCWADDRPYPCPTIQAIEKELA